jgi:hypothetical protein
MIEQERAFKGEDVVRFLKDLMGHIPGELLIIWDGSPIHRGGAVKEFVASGERLLVSNLSSCPSLRSGSQPRRRGLQAPRVRGAKEPLLPKPL